MNNVLGIFRHVKNTVTFKVGDVIFNEGDAGDYMFIVQEGLVDIILNGKVVETVGEGGILGEMALVDQESRSAGAVAKTDCRVVPVSQKQFTFMVQETPYFALQVMHIMAERLRRQHERNL
jgi:CRP/FNR family transcriptional regulator, cyclic AMP receptor protein